MTINTSFLYFFRVDWPSLGVLTSIYQHLLMKYVHLTQCLPSPQCSITIAAPLPPISVVPNAFFSLYIAILVGRTYLIQPICIKHLQRNSYQWIFNRPGVAGAVLQSPPSLTDSVIKCTLWKYLQQTFIPKP